jgi:hypothetical protein
MFLVFLTEQCTLMLALSTALVSAYSQPLLSHLALCLQPVKFPNKPPTNLDPVEFLNLHLGRNLISVVLQLA